MQCLDEFDEKINITLRSGSRLLYEIYERIKIANVICAVIEE